MGAPDVTVTVNFHREGPLALSALASLQDLVGVARAAGLAVETQAILDRPNEVTRHVVNVRGRWIDRIVEVSFGDLGLARNAGAASAHGRFLGFLDGDDVWGERWLAAAFGAATASPGALGAIWHPEYLYLYVEAKPGKPAEFVCWTLQPSDKPGFNSLSLLFANLWSANAFAARDIYHRFPYVPVERSRGIGIEDLSWNLQTLAAGIHHRIVPNSVHLIRVKESGSLDRQNSAEQLLPHLPSSVAIGIADGWFNQAAGEPSERR